MTLRDDLAAEPDPKARLRLKAAAFAALPRAARATTRGGRRIAITNGPTLDGDAVVLTLAITVGGVDVTPPDLNPVRIINPPILVDDPAGDVSVTTTEHDGQQRTSRYREDVAVSLRNIIADLL